MQIEIDGSLVFVYTAGKPLENGRPSVLFLHGAANDHSVWIWQSRWFAHHGFNALAVDLPGHGKSGGKALTSIELLAEWALHLLDRLALPIVHIVGHSMGSLVTLELASKRPLCLGKVVLAGCAVPMSVSESLLSAATHNVPEAIALINGWSHAPSTLLHGGPIPGMWQAGVNRALMMRAAAGVLFDDLSNCQNYTNGAIAAALIDRPTLLIAAERDLMTPKKASQPLLTLLRDGRVASIAGAGHAMMNERPDAFLDTLIDFLQPKK